MESLSVPRASVKLAQLPDVVGTVLGPSEWVVMTQTLVDAFTRTTGDHNSLGSGRIRHPTTNEALWCAIQPMPWPSGQRLRDE
jgi:hypothetical protein